MVSFCVICCTIVVILFCIFQTGESLNCTQYNSWGGPSSDCHPLLDRCISVFTNDGKPHIKGCGTERMCSAFRHCSSCGTDFCNRDTTSGTKPKTKPHKIFYLLFWLCYCIFN